jgi:hypothetical protein
MGETLSHQIIDFIFQPPGRILRWLWLGRHSQIKSTSSEEITPRYTGLDRPADEIWGVEYHGCLRYGNYVLIDSFGFMSLSEIEIK